MFRVKVDISGALRGLTAIEEKQTPFAVSRALNQVANDGQEAERAQLKKGFKLRREQWNLRGIKIEKADRANKSTWRVVIQVAAQTDYLDRFELGGEKMPTKGKWLWVPGPVFGRKIIDRSNPLHPKNLHFEQRGGTMRGNERTYMLKASNGQVLVLQRTDRRLTKGAQRRVGKMDLDSFKGGMGPATKGEKYSLQRTEGSRLLYRLVDRVNLPASLEFVHTITAEVQARWPQRVGDALEQALRTAR